jgi:hypothetical protein
MKADNADTAFGLDLDILGAHGFPPFTFCSS